LTPPGVRGTWAMAFLALIVAVVVVACVCQWWTMRE
jgi:hypothetical protein